MAVADVGTVAVVTAPLTVEEDKELFLPLWLPKTPKVAIMKIL